MNNYIDIEAFAKDIFGALKVKRETVCFECNEKYAKDCLRHAYSDKQLYGCAKERASELNEWIDDLLLGESKVKFDFDLIDKFQCAYSQSGGDNFWDLYQRLNSHKDTLQAKKDRSFVRNWFDCAFHVQDHILSDFERELKDAIEYYKATESDIEELYKTAKGE